MRSLKEVKRVNVKDTEYLVIDIDKENNQVRFYENPSKNMILEEIVENYILYSMPLDIFKKQIGE